jgi:hypothetical protein
MAQRRTSQSSSHSKPPPPSITSDSLLVTETLLYNVTLSRPTSTNVDGVVPRPSTSQSGRATSSRSSKRVSFASNNGSTKQERPITSEAARTVSPKTTDKKRPSSPTTTSSPREGQGRLQWMPIEAAEGIEKSEEEYDDNHDDDDIERTIPEGTEGFVLEVRESKRGSKKGAGRRRRKNNYRKSRRRSKSPLSSQQTNQQQKSKRLSSQSSSQSPSARGSPIKTKLTYKKKQKKKRSFIPSHRSMNSLRPSSPTLTAAAEEQKAAEEEAALFHPDNETLLYEPLSTESSPRQQPPPRSPIPSTILEDPYTQAALEELFAHHQHVDTPTYSPMSSTTASSTVANTTMTNHFPPRPNTGASLRGGMGGFSGMSSMGAGGRNVFTPKESMGTSTSSTASQNSRSRSRRKRRTSDDEKKTIPIVGTPRRSSAPPATIRNKKRAPTSPTTSRKATPVTSALLWADNASSKAWKMNKEGRRKGSPISSSRSTPNIMNTPTSSRLSSPLNSTNGSLPVSRMALFPPPSSPSPSIAQRPLLVSREAPSETEQVLNEMKKIGIVDNLKYGSQTISPDRATKLNIHPLRMPTIDRTTAIERMNERRRQDEKQGFDGGGGGGGGGSRSVPAKRKKRMIPPSNSPSHLSISTKIIFSPDNISKYQQKLMNNNTNTAKEYKAEDIMKINRLLNQSMSEKQKENLFRSRTWNRSKEKGQVANHDAWDEYCLENIQKAPMEMKRKLLKSEHFLRVEKSSHEMRRKKKKNDRASEKLSMFLIKRKRERRDNLWLSYAKNASPQLTSDWFQYLERHEREHPVDGRTRATVSLLED